jgi:hypothetical protein
MKKNKLIYIPFTFCLISIISFVSCKDDEPLPEPSFTPEVIFDTKVVTFTNASTNAVSYSWDFGDDSDPSTEVNPTHTYEKYADYDVRLTATGSGGTVTRRISISVVKNWPEINIDGDFSDWDNVPFFYEGNGETGSLEEAKVTYDGSSTLYFYVKGTDLGPILEVFINTDGDFATGWQATDFYTNDGSDFSLELYVEDFNDGGEMLKGFGLYKYMPDSDQEWPWDGEDGGINVWYSDDGYDHLVSATEIVDNQIELSIDVSVLELSPDRISLYFENWDNNWEGIGWIPAQNQDPLETPAYLEFQ